MDDELQKTEARLHNASAWFKSNAHECDYKWDKAWTKFMELIYKRRELKNPTPVQRSLF